ncbi:MULTISPECIES: DUF6626 family protein [Roseobacteraceae]|uniref:DUF6626 family protein n=1 Tax=Roseobacteraceae TaxID=2854170 RepID=UPI00051DD6E1|nr:DUF6626 family protein [Thalassobacter sp. 16PALIMAR09]KGL00747.1 hypothetical protein PM04_13420 [Thalassobacter sp. 16PALIMAR09]
MAEKLTIENICNLVIAEGLADNEQDFCERWLCRGEGYMRTLRFRGLQPSTDALAVCANKLGFYADAFLSSGRNYSVQTGKNLRQLQQLCEHELTQAAKSKWQGYSIQ